MFLKETKAKRKSGRVVNYLQLVSSYWDKDRKIPIKSVLRIRPMYHHSDHRIISHVKLCVLAYFIVRYVEVKTGQSWEQISRLFRQLHVVELITEAGSVFRRSELFKEHRTVLKALDISLPSEIQDVSVPNGL